MNTPIQNVYKKIYLKTPRVYIYIYIPGQLVMSFKRKWLDIK